MHCHHQPVGRSTSSASRLGAGGHRRLCNPAHRVSLQGGSGNKGTSAPKPLLQPTRTLVAEHRSAETGDTVECSSRSGESLRRKHGGLHACPRRGPDLREPLRTPVDPSLSRSGGSRRRDRKGRCDAVIVEVSCHRRPGSSPEGAEHARGPEAASLRLGAVCLCHHGHHSKAGRHRRRHVAGSPCQHGWKDDRAKMNPTCRKEVVLGAGVHPRRQPEREDSRTRRARQGSFDGCRLALCSDGGEEVGEHRGPQRRRIFCCSSHGDFGKPLNGRRRHRARGHGRAVPSTLAEPVSMSRPRSTLP